MELPTLLVFAALRGCGPAGCSSSTATLPSDNADPTAYDPHRAVVAEGVRLGALVALDGLVAVPPA